MKREFSVFITSAAERSYKKLPRKVADFVSRELVCILGKDPMAGKPLAAPLTPLRSFHFSCDGQPYRAAYSVEYASQRIIIHLVGYRGNFYERLRRLLRV